MNPEEVKKLEMEILQVKEVFFTYKIPNPGYNDCLNPDKIVAEDDSFDLFEEELKM
jgi:hypothetical protein